MTYEYLKSIMVFEIHAKNIIYIYNLKSLFFKNSDLSTIQTPSSNSGEIETCDWMAYRSHMFRSKATSTFQLLRTTTARGRALSKAGDGEDVLVRTGQKNLGDSETYIISESYGTERQPWCSWSESFRETFSVFSGEKTGDGMESTLWRSHLSLLLWETWIPTKRKNRRKCWRGRREADKRGGREGMGLTPRKEQNNKNKTSQKKTNKVGDRKEYMKRSSELTFQTRQMSE